MSTLSDTLSDLCCARRVSVLEERVSDLEATQRHSQSLGLSACCAGHGTRSKGLR